MKTIFNLLFIILCSVSSIAQKNNTEDKYGLNYANSLNKIKADYIAGKISSLTQNQLDSYSDTLGVGSKITLDAAATIISKLKDTSLRFTTIVNNSSLSSISKTMLIDLITNKNGLNADKMREQLFNNVEVIKNSRLNLDEKKTMQSIIAMMYNNISTPGLGMRQMLSCALIGGVGFGETHEDTGVNWECAIVMGVAGAVTGFGICGAGCAVIGGIIGGVIGGIS